MLQGQKVTGDYDYVNLRTLDVLKELGCQSFSERQNYNTACLTYKMYKRQCAILFTKLSY